MAKQHRNELLDGLKSDMAGTQLPDECQVGSGTDWAWLVIDWHGRMIVSGPFANREMAEQKAYESLNGNSYRVELLQTKSKPKAVSILKQKRWGATGDLGKALERAGHKLPSEYKSREWIGKAGLGEDN